MNTIPLTAMKGLTALLLAVSGLALFSNGAQAADAQSKASIQKKYEQDVADCKSGKGGQDPAACLREAGAARDASNKQSLSTENEDQLQRNALDRCNKLPEANRKDCVAGMTSSNTNVSGSVQAGGVLRETTTQVPLGTPGSTPQSTAPSR